MPVLQIYTSRPETTVLIETFHKGFHGGDQFLKNSETKGREIEEPGREARGRTAPSHVIGSTLSESLSEVSWRRHWSIKTRRARQYTAGQQASAVQVLSRQSAKYPERA